MTYNVLMGTLIIQRQLVRRRNMAWVTTRALNPTHSLTPAQHSKRIEHLLTFYCYRIIVDNTVSEQSSVVNLSAEKNASELVTRLLEMSEKARKTEELLEQMERERQVSYA